MSSSKTRTFICPWCRQPSTAVIQGVAIWSGYNIHNDWMDSPTEYALLQCGQCGDASIQARQDFGGGFEQDEPSIVYPAPRRLSPSIPEPLRREWSEAHSCFEAKAYAACVVMVRRTVEGTCKELGVSKGTLGRSLKELRDQGLIDGTLAEWADTLRLAGNQGAHYTGHAVPREDAEDALAFAEALLDHVYVLRKKFKAFQDRLAKRGKQEGAKKLSATRRAASDKRKGQ